MEFKQNTLERTATTLVITKAKTLPHGQFEAILSTDDLDRHGEHVSIKGLVIPKDQVIKMYYNHETSGANLPIGKWLKVWKKDGKLYGLGEVDNEDEFAMKVYKKILKGIIDSISIGFYPTEYDGESSTWTASTLVEASVVAEPANVNAVITSKQLGFTQEEFKQSLTVKLKAVADEIEGDTADPKEEEDTPEPIEGEKKLEADETLTVKVLRKGLVEDIITEPKKWEMMQPFYEVMYAFESAYYREDTPGTDFEKLLKETISLLETVANGTYEYADKSVSDASSTNEVAEMKSAIEDLKSKLGAVESAVTASAENPAIKQLIKVRTLAKEVDKSAEELNRVIKVKLKDSI